MTSPDFRRLGGQAALEDEGWLKSEGITHVLSLGEGKDQRIDPERAENLDIDSRQILVSDDLDVSDAFATCLIEIGATREGGGCCYVHWLLCRPPCRRYLRRSARASVPSPTYARLWQQRCP